MKNTSKQNEAERANRGVEEGKRNGKVVVEISVFQLVTIRIEESDFDVVEPEAVDLIGASDFLDPVRHFSLEAKDGRSLGAV